MPRSDAPAPPETTPVRRSLRIPVISGVVIALLAGALVVGLVLWRTSDDPARTPTASAPVQGFPEAGASRTVTEVLPSGILQVKHWIHTVEPISDLDLSVPDVPQADAIEVSSVQVTADDQPASGPATISFSRASYVFADATHILVTYQLSGAVELSTSAPGRGLATTTALEVSAPQERDTRVIRSRAILSLACAAPVDAEPTPCGTADSEDQWRVDLTGNGLGARVVAAVTVS